MLTLLLVRSKAIRSALIARLNLRETIQESDIHFYQQGKWILGWSEKPFEDIRKAAFEQYKSDRVYCLFFGQAIDVVHEKGDIIIPHTILPYKSEVETTDFTTENRDTFLSDAFFIDIFKEHKDYYLENFGLSLGGIAVMQSPKNIRFPDRVMSAYEADIYIEDDLRPLLDEPQQTFFIMGILEGKSPRHARESIETCISENIITTIELLENKSIATKEAPNTTDFFI